MIDSEVAHVLSSKRGNNSGVHGIGDQIRSADDELFHASLEWIGSDGTKARCAMRHTDKSTSGIAGVVGEGKFLVLDPTGYPPQVTQLGMAPRLESLDGRKVYLIDCRYDDSDIFLRQMQAWFAENMPTVEAVFVQKTGVMVQDDPRLWEEIKANNAAAAVGVGH